jgi:osmotically-inducible protein OsmY
MVNSRFNGFKMPLSLIVKDFIKQNCRAVPTLLALALVLPGCAPVLIGGSMAGAGMAALYDRRPAQTLLDDQQIQLAARYALEHDLKTQAVASRVDVTSYNHTVLLTGQVEAEAHGRRVTERISRLPKVKQVINELTFGAALTFARQTEDMYLSSRAKLALTQITLPDFNAARVKVVTENGVVYLLGIVRPAEATAAAEQVRYLPGVRRVVKLFEYQ